MLEPFVSEIRAAKLENWRMLSFIFLRVVVVYGVSMRTRANAYRTETTLLVKRESQQNSQVPDRRCNLSLLRGQGSSTSPPAVRCSQDESLNLWMLVPAHRFSASRIIILRIHAPCSKP